MAKTGRPAKPTAVKKREGKRGKRKLPDAADEPKFSRSTSLKAPSWLPSAAAKAEWNRMAPELDSQGLLTTADEQNFGIYCTNVGRYRALLKLEKLGRLFVCESGYEQVKPIMGLIDKCEKAIASFGAKFGLDPVARAGMGKQGMDERRKGFKEFIG